MKYIQVFLTTTTVIILCQRNVYLHEYMSDYEKFNETSLSETEDF